MTTCTGYRWDNLRQSRGFTLLEFLIALLIVSFGLLGIAGIIANSMKSNQSAYYRTQAVVMAGDIIDRMRANRIAADGGPVSPYPASPYNLAMTAPTPTTCTPPSTVPVPDCDLYYWRSALAATLPSGNGSVDVHATTKKVIVVVRWDDSRAAGGDPEQDFTVETRL